VTESLKSLLVVGGQWGDEGKGKVVDLLSAGFKVVVRYNGGHNAGHTVRFADRRFALHLIPSGIIHDDSVCYLAAGMVIDPTALIQEIDRLRDGGVDASGRLHLSSRATLILPTHRALDNAREGARGSSKIGTTGRGIGPAYQDQAQRRALRAFLLAQPGRLVREATELMRQHNDELEKLFGAEPVELDQAVDELQTAAGRLGPLVRDIGPAVISHAKQGDPVLFEGAQGVLLDMYHGTYPFVTSSSCLPGFAATACGISPRYVGPSIGIMKAYVTRVGGGPFPTELEDEAGERLRSQGAEFGTTTGRPRRCGWFDAVVGRYAVEVAGIEAIALMKLDILDGFENLKVAVGYDLPDGGTLDCLPADLELLAKVKPRYVELPGWSQTTAGVTDVGGLPGEAREYLRFLEANLGVPIVLVSTGPRRNETLITGKTTLAEQLRMLLGDSLS